MKLFRRCKHENVRCIHGDEIWLTARAFRRPVFARVACAHCGKPLYKRDLPILCSFTWQPHDRFNEFFDDFLRRSHGR